MKSFAAVLALAALATASPLTGTPPKDPKDASDACGENVVSCCNSGTEENSSGILSGIVGPILSNTCLGASISAVNILSGLTDTSGMCGDNEVKCCEGNKNTGLVVVDAQCTSL